VEKEAEVNLPEEGSGKKLLENLLGKQLKSVLFEQLEKTLMTVMIEESMASLGVHQRIFLEYD